jgi:hypothetical protein
MLTLKYKFHRTQKKNEEGSWKVVNGRKRKWNSPECLGSVPKVLETDNYWLSKSVPTAINFEAFEEMLDDINGQRKNGKNSQIFPIFVARIINI